MSDLTDPGIEPRPPAPIAMCLTTELGISHQIEKFTMSRVASMKNEATSPQVGKVTKAVYAKVFAGFSAHTVIHANKTSEMQR